MALQWQFPDAPDYLRRATQKDAGRLGRPGKGECSILRRHAEGRVDGRGVFSSGEQTVAECLNDMTNICQGKDPGEMRIIEIGCGAGA